jgi:hypothetical protein
MTLNVYSHVTQDIQEEASQRFENAMKLAKNTLT